MADLVSTVMFYLFSGVMLGSGLMVISAKNPVHAVLFLILAFFNAAGLFVLAGAEFLAMTLVIVYVGAVAVLFLFVVMMLDVNFSELRRGFLNYLPIGVLVGLVFLVELLFVLGSWAIGPGIPRSIIVPIPPADVMSNTEALGQLLYTRYVYFFQAAGVVLLVAMIGAIVLTLHHKPKARRQNISDQVARSPKAQLSLRQVRPGQGI
jgi:NADH-quinone oxidoreductase subunit J